MKMMLMMIMMIMMVLMMLTSGYKRTMVMTLSIPKRGWLQSIGTGFVIASMIPMIDSMSSSSVEYHHFIPEAHADSTGKFSTKLTARKRYYPRIVEGVKQFNSIATLKDNGINPFSEEENIAKFKRALSLYGASLRKGEVPDEISRQAEEKTASFIGELEKLSKSGSKMSDDKIKVLRVALDDYLSFAKLEPSSSQIYK